MGRKTCRSVTVTSKWRERLLFKTGWNYLLEFTASMNEINFPHLQARYIHVDIIYQGPRMMANIAV